MTNFNLLQMIGSGNGPERKKAISLLKARAASGPEYLDLTWGGLTVFGVLFFSKDELVGATIVHPTTKEAKHITPAQFGQCFSDNPGGFMESNAAWSAFFLPPGTLNLTSDSIE